MFESIIGEAETAALRRDFGGELPESVVDDILLWVFPFTDEQLHEILDDHYDPAAGVYRYESGRGGGASESVVTGVDASAEDGTVRLTYETYSGYSSREEEPYGYPTKRVGVLTLKPYGDRYQYWSVEVGEAMQAPVLGRGEEDASPE